MSQRREIEARLALYDDLSGILGAMRSFALAELHRVTRREAAQREVVTNLACSLADLSPALPESPPVVCDIWLLFGSVRGFCGSFNEDVITVWQKVGGAATPVVTVGERLAATLEQREVDGRLHFQVPGPIGALDAAAAVDRILEACAEARKQVLGEAGLMLCFRGEDGAHSERLLPLPTPTATVGSQLPLTLEPAGRVVKKAVDHYLFHSLLARLLTAIRVENHMRLAQMENALQHLGRSTEELQRRHNRVRQEEIVEEIELILQNQTMA